MTEKNRKTNIAEELSRAQTALGAADLLAANRFLNEAVSRSGSMPTWRERATCRLERSGG